MDKSPVTSGKVVIARSQRYHNHKFDWKSILKIHSDCVFIGLPGEHAEFTSKVESVPYLKVTDALDMAEKIAGSRLFVGNQSFPCWLAMGLGHPLIQESYIHSLNSRLTRSNAKFVLDRIKL